MHPTLRTFRPWIFLILVALIALPVAAQDDVHVVQPGENLFRIALRYEMTTTELAEANGISDTSRVLAGQLLTIPTGAGGPAISQPLPSQPLLEETSTITGVDPMQPAFPVVVADEDAPQIETTPVYHTIQRGDSLRNLAQQFGTTESQLMTWNDIANPNVIYVGQQLMVGEETIGEASEAAAPIVSELEFSIEERAAAEETFEASPRHIVQQGEYLSSIARRYGVSAELIVSLNNIGDANQLYPGQELVIPTTEDIDVLKPLIFPEPGAQVGTGREIVVDLSNSRVYAYENSILMYEAVASTGLPATPTVQGSYTVYNKTRAQTMSGPGYYLPNVEWVMYFYQGYGLHGTYWHENFGQPMSHGCVNLTNTDARWFFEFAEIGTPVTVRT